MTDHQETSPLSNIPVMVGGLTWSSHLISSATLRNKGFYSLTEHQARSCVGIWTADSTLDGVSAHHCAVLSSEWCSKPALSILSLSNPHIFSVLAAVHPSPVTAEGGELLLSQRWGFTSLIALLHTFRDSFAVLSFSAKTFTLIWICSQIFLRESPTDAVLNPGNH